MKSVFMQKSGFPETVPIAHEKSKGMRGVKKRPLRIPQTGALRGLLPKRLDADSRGGENWRG